MKPALTKEEWEEVRRQEEGDYNKAPTVAALYRKIKTLPPVVSDRMDALAALCGWRQPWWFTHEDVRALMTAGGREIGELEQALYDLAERIAALIPPEET